MESGHSLPECPKFQYVATKTISYWYQLLIPEKKIYIYIYIFLTDFQVRLVLKFINSGKLNKCMCLWLVSLSVYLVVQFYPWFKVYENKYMIMNMKQKKIKVEPRIKLNYNI